AGFIRAVRSSISVRPSAPGVLVGVAVRGRILVAARGLTNRGAVAVLARRAIRGAPICGVHLTCRSLRGRLMLAVRSVAVFRNRRGPIAAIGIGTLHGRGRSPGSWVVCLTGTYTAVAVRDCAATRISPGGWVIATAGMRAAVWSIGARTGAIVATVPGAVSVVCPAVIHHRSGAVPAA